MTRRCTRHVYGDSTDTAYVGQRPVATEHKHAGSRVHYTTVIFSSGSLNCIDKQIVCVPFALRSKTPAINCMAAV